MRATSFRAVVAAMMAGLSLMAVPPARGQWFPAGQPCGCGQPMVTPMAYNPCPVIQPVAINPCPCLQPVTETVYRDVPVVEYRQETRTVQRPVARTEYVDRPVTRYRTEYETQTRQVQSVQYQQVLECQPQVHNQSYWQTVYQPIPKVAPCQYDPNPTLLGWFNRTGYAIRSAFTPNYIPRRQFVPNVTVQNVPHYRTVAVPTTQEVAYQVAKLVPYQDTERVAVTRIEYVEDTQTVMVPFTTTRTVAVGTQTRYAYVPLGTGSSTTAGAEPTPAGSRTAEQPDNSRGSTSPMQQVQPRPSGQQISFPPANQPTPVNPQTPGNFLDTHYVPEQQSQQPSYAQPRPVQQAASTAEIRTAGWRPRQSTSNDAPAILQGPAFSVASTEPQ